MKVFSNTVTFDYSWEEVSTANWRKYCPWNEKSTHVVAVDTLASTVDPATGILRTERLITCRQSAPEWLKTVFGSSLCNGGESQVFETSYVDPRARSVIMVSQNLTWSNLLSVQETVIYRPSAASAHQTQFVQDAKITALCGGWQRIRNAIEDSLVTRFRDNAAKGREGFEAVLAMSRRVFAEEKERERMLASATAAAVAAAGNPFQHHRHQQRQLAGNNHERNGAMDHDDDDHHHPYHIGGDDSSRQTMTLTQ